MEAMRDRLEHLELALDKLVDLTSDLKSSIAITDTKVDIITKNGDNLEKYLDDRRDQYEQFVVKVEKLFLTKEMERNAAIDSAVKPLEETVEIIKRKYHIAMGIVMAVSWVIGGLLIPLFEGTGPTILQKFFGGH